MPRSLLLALSFAGFVLLVGCSRHAPESGRRAADFPSNVVAYDVKGVLREIRANGWKALIEHEDIPGYMEAMTMLLDVKNTNELAAVRPGDLIRFRMLVTDTDGWIDRVQGTGRTNMTAAASIPETLPSWLDELEPGAGLPDCVLTNQLGRVIRLSDFKGSALAFTFIFTRCPFPTYCPRMNNHLASAQRQLAADGAGTNWHLLSISIDPEFDTSARLAKYAETYGYDPARWSFATGLAESIRRLGSSFGLMFASKNGTIEHNVRTVVVDAAGRVQRVFAGNEWKPEELVEELKKAMAAKS